MILTLNGEQRMKLLDLCVMYFPSTKMRFYNVAEGYKDHCVYFVKENNATGYNTWLNTTDIIPESPLIVLGFNQFEATDGIEYEYEINIHWYELCVNELAEQIYKLQYDSRIACLLNSDLHPVDFLHNEYLEDCDLTFF